jgi:putative addiction module component (TIGR02574 family)
MVFAPMSDLLQLPQSERLALAIALWDSLGAELDRRWASHLDNPDAALAWDEVRSQLGLG